MPSAPNSSGHNGQNDGPIEIECWYFAQWTWTTPHPSCVIAHRPTSTTAVTPYLVQRLEKSRTTRPRGSAIRCSSLAAALPGGLFADAESLADPGPRTS